MRVNEVMSGCVTVCTEDTALEEVYELIQKCDHRFVVVVDSNAHRVPIGVVSEHSICEQIIGRGRNPRTLLAGSVMDARIRKISEDEIVENIVKTDDVTAFVVVNRDRRVSGILPKEAIKPAAPIVSQVTPAVHVSVNPAPARTRRVSEIPAFGWIQ